MCCRKPPQSFLCQKWERKEHTLCNGLFRLDFFRFKYLEVARNRASENFFQRSITQNGHTGAVYLFFSFPNTCSSCVLCYWQFLLSPTPSGISHFNWTINWNEIVLLESIASKVIFFHILFYLSVSLFVSFQSILAVSCKAESFHNQMEYVSSPMSMAAANIYFLRLVFFFCALPFVCFFGFLLIYVKFQCTWTNRPRSYNSKNQFRIRWTA